MKDNNKHSNRIDSIINTPLVDSNMRISVDFVDQVMNKVEKITPSNPYLKYMVNIAASLAFLMLVGNLFLVMQQINTSAQNQVIDEWTSVYENSDESSWSVYYDIELLASSDKTK
ncbi:hypothetical protein [Carboxylicivirga linearis]|uniref:Uncharacterized protein n=1 Tax=Carboxylicivirga linearis TaxID=1628157 RepID=A0ABS5JYT6_9BACT|nr:hypothetical protein [Carboxylicivirga linearis]MBS2100075.1 hypothetical protein [Carboxylicivirga linearis]